MFYELEEVDKSKTAKNKIRWFWKPNTLYL